MKVLSSQSVASDVNCALNELLQPIEEQGDILPDLMIVYANRQLLTDDMAVGLQAKTSKLLLASSCRGAMTDQGVAQGDNGGAGLLALYDPEGAYGIGQRLVGENIQQAGYEALEAAMADAGRAWESPDLIWCSLPPGNEEAVLQGMRELVGDSTPIIGGSIADNDVSGQWLQLSQGRLVNDHIVVVALFPSKGVGVSFSSGYTPTDDSAVVTKASGREILTLDGEPAAHVYARWTKDVVNDPSIEQGILAASTFSPLGQVVHYQDGIGQYLLSHPESVSPDGGLRLFSCIEEGERVFKMSGSRDSLVIRASRVMDNAVNRLPSNVKPAGALMVYCAGCMLAVSDDLTDVVANIKGSFDAPFLGTFTFGEQGCFTDRINRHGNLMISAVVFGGE